MMGVLLIQKLVSAAVLLTALTVGVLTIRHGDLSLGMLVLLGQVQSLFGGNHGHAVKEEATHLVVHQQI